MVQYVSHKQWGIGKEKDITAHIKLSGFKGHNKKGVPYRNVPLRLKMFSDIDSDFDLCFNWAERYNKRNHIDFLGEDLKQTVREAFEYNGFLGIFYKESMICLVPLEVLSTSMGYVIDFQNFMFDKYSPNYAGVMYSVILEICLDVQNRFKSEDSYTLSLRPFIYNEVIDDFIGYIRGISFRMSDLDEGFRTLKVSYKKVVKDCKTHCLKFVGSFMPSSELIETVSNESVVDCESSSDIESINSLKHTYSLILPLNYLSCNLDIVGKFCKEKLDKQYIEEKSYTPLLINENREVVKNCTTFAILKSHNVKYAKCVIDLG